jgi:CelD/BcsL family acetyltransferase involved in cellulose biosynthesis
MLDEGFTVEASGWKGEQRSAIVADHRTEAFYRSVAAWAAREGMLRLGFLRSNGRAVAFDLCLEWNSVHFLLKTGYDPAYAQYAPGKLLREAMIARAFAEGMHRYEFLGGAAAWKREWTRAVRVSVRVQAFRRGISGSLAHSVHSYGRPQAKRLLKALRA